MTHWPFTEFSIPSTTAIHTEPVAKPHRTRSPMPSIDSEPQEIECEELSDLGVYISTGDE